MELIGMILAGLLAFAVLALGLAGYVRWRAHRRMDDAVAHAAAEAAQAARNGGGGGGPANPVR
jgi:uncharacterized iron-regulated membrane protein